MNLDGYSNRQLPIQRVKKLLVDCNISGFNGRSDSYLSDNGDTCLLRRRCKIIFQSELWAVIKISTSIYSEYCMYHTRCQIRLMQQTFCAPKVNTLDIQFPFHMIRHPDIAETCRKGAIIRDSLIMAPREYRKMYEGCHHPGFPDNGTPIVPENVGRKLCRDCFYFW